VYRDTNITKTSDRDGYQARKEDTDRIFDDALSVITHIVFYLAPLRGNWPAPEHPYLADDRGDPPAGWIRAGPAAATRAWCLFELSTALAEGKQLCVELSPADRVELRQILETDARKLDAALADIDARDAQVSKVEDREHILPRVLAAGGFDGVNHRVQTALREWLAASGLSLLHEAECEGSPNTLALQNGVGRLLYAQGKVEAAEPVFRQALQVSEEMLGALHSDTLKTANNLALALKHQGKLEDAMQLLRHVLEGRESTLGHRHPETLQALNTLAMVLYKQGNLAEAAPLMRRALNDLELAFGTDHPHTMEAVKQLALLLQAQGEAEEAAQLFQRALEGSRERLGPAHPDTLYSTNNMASVLEAQGRLDEAALMLRHVLEGFESSLGAAHPETLQAIGKLSSILYAQGNLSQAEPLCRRALEGFELNLGAAHPRTLTAVNDLAALLEAQCRPDEAAALRVQFELST